MVCVYGSRRTQWLIVVCVIGVRCHIAKRVCHRIQKALRCVVVICGDFSVLVGSRGKVVVVSRVSIVHPARKGPALIGHRDAGRHAAIRGRIGIARHDPVLRRRGQDVMVIVVSIGLIVLLGPVLFKGDLRDIRTVVGIADRIPRIALLENESAVTVVTVVRPVVVLIDIKVVKVCVVDLLVVEAPEQDLVEGARRLNGPGNALHFLRVGVEPERFTGN